MRENIPVAQRTRVLIVDDSGAMRAILKKILQVDPRIDVVGTAADAEIARRMLKELNPDVLLLDVEMPGTDGMWHRGPGAHQLKAAQHFAVASLYEVRR